MTRVLANVNCCRKTFSLIPISKATVCCSHRTFASKKEETPETIKSWYDQLLEEAQLNRKPDLPPNIQVSKSFHSVPFSVKVFYAGCILFAILVCIGVTCQSGYFQFEPVYEDDTQLKQKQNK